jgi:hypothetical protein
MDRYWLLTSTFYGNWLPGGPRGSVTSVHDEPGARRRHNSPGAPVDGPMPPFALRCSTCGTRNIRS